MSKASKGMRGISRSKISNKNSSPNRNVKFSGGGVVSLLGILLIIIADNILHYVGICVFAYGFSMLRIARIRNTVLPEGTCCSDDSGSFYWDEPDNSPDQEMKPYVFKHEEQRKKPSYSMPDRILGEPLAYEYRDVEVFIPDNFDVDLNDLESAYLTLRAEQPNEQDEKPVAVYYDAMENGKVVSSCKLGYMYSGVKRDMVRDFLGQDKPFIARVQKVEPTQRKLYIHLAFYRSRNFSSCPIFRLVYNTNQEYQNNIMQCKVGDNVSIILKDGKWCATCAGVIGFFPKQAEYIVQDCPPCSIDRIETMADGKRRVYVMCYLKN